MGDYDDGYEYEGADYDPMGGDDILGEYEAPPPARRGAKRRQAATAPPAPSAKRARSRAGSEKKRDANAWNDFCSYYRPIVQENFPNASAQAVTSALSKMYHQQKEGRRLKAEKITR